MRYVRVDVSDEYMPSYSSSGDDTASSSASADEDEVEDEADRQLKEAVRVARQQVKWRLPPHGGTSTSSPA